ncbi:MAG TPA: ATP-binding protein [Puia sp.]|nr:ATP-binding protein [Puia sp.]
MTETQNIEYKQHWRDEYLKWICGFANAQGGKMFIGIDDNGEVVGIDDYQKLMEDIPNKAVNHLGLMIKKENKHFLEIDVPISSVPISYHGIYHYRSGATKQELKGVSLQNWLLKKVGKNWEDLPAPSAILLDLDENSIHKFLKKAIAQKRIPSEAMSEGATALLENLHLLTKEGQPTNAAVLLFGKKTSAISPTCSFKIGRFGKTDDDLHFQDIIDCNLISMPDEILSKLTDRYLLRPISYKGFERQEPLEYPESALREAILNAIIHKDYASTWIFLRVYGDKLELWNPGVLPEQLTIEKLKGRHSSYPRNPHIAEVFFKAGYIEAWGRGTTKMITECLASGLPEPQLEEDQGGIRVTFLKNTKTDLTNLGLNERQVKAVLIAKENGYITNRQYQKEFGVTDRTALRDLNELVERQLFYSTGATRDRRYHLKN